MKLSVCIPMYNERAVIADTAKRLADALDARFVGDYELIFSDDGSTDGSADCVRALELPCVRVIGYPENRGKGCAVRTAMLAANGEIALFTDADLAYGTDVIVQAVELFSEHPERAVIVGSRNLEKDGYIGYTFWRRVASKAYIRVLCMVGGLKLSDSQCGFKAFRKDAAQAIFSRCRTNGFAFDLEAILWAQALDFKVSEMPVRVLVHRDSKIRLVRDAFRMFRNVIGIRRDVAKRSRSEKTSH